MIIQRLSLSDASMPGVRLSAEVTPGGQVMLWVRDESVSSRPVAAGIVLDGNQEADLLAWLAKVAPR